MELPGSLLLIDFSNTIIRSLAVHQQLSFNGVPTGGLFGFINQLANVIKSHKPTKILVCKDRPPYLRSELYPEYKANRKKSGESKTFSAAIKTSFQQVDELLKLFEIPTWSVPGLEADDLIAEIVKKYNVYEKIFVLSNDDDLNQLLDTENLVLLRKNKEYNYWNFKQEFPTIEPEDWVLLTALTGTHNGVSGIPRVGLKTAIKYLNNNDKLITVVNQHEELINRNCNLIELPLDGTEKYSPPIINTPKLNETDLIRYIEAYGIRYALHMSTAFFEYSTRNPRNVR